MKRTVEYRHELDPEAEWFMAKCATLCVIRPQEKPIMMNTRVVRPLAAHRRVRERREEFRPAQIIRR